VDPVPDPLLLRKFDSPGESNPGPLDLIGSIRVSLGIKIHVKTNVEWAPLDFIISSGLKRKYLYYGPQN
jgi:hypothetical protein